MADEWTDRLSAYLDDQLHHDDRVALEEHLSECTSCRGALAELERVVTWAEEYRGRPPRRDVWPEISAEIGTRRGAPKVVELPRRPVSWMPRALAAGIALAVVAAGSWWLARTTAPTDPTPTIVVWEPSTGPSVEVTMLASERYGAAVAQLEQALIDGEGRLDSATVRIVREKLTVVDRAIQEARQALARDPNSSYLAGHYAKMMQRKLMLLRNVARAATVAS